MVAARHDVIVAVKSPFSSGVISVVNTLKQCANFLNFNTVSACYGVGVEHHVSIYCCAVRAQSSIGASEIMDEIKLIESRMNFKSELLLLSFEHMVRLDPQLTLPHPDLVQDTALLHTAAEVWGDFQHPVLHRSLNELKLDLEDFGELEFILSGRELKSKILRYAVPFT